MEMDVNKAYKCRSHKHKLLFEFLILQYDTQRYFDH